MIVEERDYTVKPGKLPKFVSTYEKFGLPIQLEHLGNLLGYFTSKIGELNHVVAWWSFESLDDRQIRRGRMLADPRWADYLLQVTDLIDLQKNRVLSPVAFSPLR